MYIRTICPSRSVLLRSTQIIIRVSHWNSILLQTTEKYIMAALSINPRCSEMTYHFALATTPRYFKPITSCLTNTPTGFVTRHASMRGGDGESPTWTGHACHPAILCLSLFAFPRTVFRAARPSVRPFYWLTVAIVRCRFISRRTHLDINCNAPQSLLISTTVQPVTEQKAPITRRFGDDRLSTWPRFIVLLDT